MVKTNQFECSNISTNHERPLTDDCFQRGYRYLTVDIIESNNPVQNDRVMRNNKRNETNKLNEAKEMTMLSNQMFSSQNCSSSCSVVILGELSVGKSALCRGFFRKNLSQTQKLLEKKMTNEQIEKEIFDDYNDEPDRSHHIFEIPVFVDDVESKIKILDVNTEKLFMESNCLDGFGDLKQYLDAGDGYIVAYAVTDKGTFETASDILKTIKELKMHSKSNIPVILVGNKCDLVRKRQVSVEKGIKLAEKFQVKFIETSATFHQNVDQLFHGIITQIRLRGLERKISCSNRSTTNSRNGESPQSSQSSLCLKQMDYSSSKAQTSRKFEKSNKTNKDSLAGKCLKKLVKTKCQKSCQNFSIL